MAYFQSKSSVPSLVWKWYGEESTYFH